MCISLLQVEKYIAFITEIFDGSRYDIVSYKTCNYPKPAKTIYNQPKPPKPAKTSHSYPKPVTTTQNHLKSAKPTEREKQNRNL